MPRCGGHCRSLYVPPGAARDAWGCRRCLGLIYAVQRYKTLRHPMRRVVLAALARGQATNGRPSGAACRGFAGSLDGRTVMADDRDARADAEIRARLEAEAEPTKAALRELARRGPVETGSGRRQGDTTQVACHRGCERAAGFARLDPGGDQAMRDVSRELANYHTPSKDRTPR